MNSRKSGTGERKTVRASDAAAWSAWLDSNAGTDREIWLEFPKRHTSQPSVTYEEALDEALCRGWIDSVIRKVNDDVYLRKFTPRTNTTNWSAKNLAAVKRLIADGRMRPEGLAVLGVAIDGAKSPAASDGAEIPPFVEEAIGANQKTRVFWDSLAPGYRKRYIGWIMSAKQDQTRQIRLSRVIGFLEEGKKSVMV